MEGLIFEFAIPPFKGDVRSETSKYLAENAFGFIESIIYNNVPNYQNYGHWGITEVNKEQWFLIKSALIKLKQKVDKSAKLIELKNDLFDFKFIFDDDLQEVTKNFSKYKSFFSQMISDFITWIDENIHKHGSIYILGI
ncbi:MULTISPECIES: hypothetical protein [unclassified Gilliamella]|nr:MULTISPECIES: hypothetical protein [unclassified Gilliamella]MWP50103.1 hypothetical protein [Gilliamella sp. Lep-s35]MWP69815.1 hypothetical protein [Gilliamella sp. Lep-s5]MWP78138.1 hypothetical protein [Gilliamella sp. Lep-s21]